MEDGAGSDLHAAFEVLNRGNLSRCAGVQRMVTWTPGIDAATGHLPIPTSPGLDLDLNMDVVRDAYFDTSRPGWEKRLGAGTKVS